MNDLQELFNIEAEQAVLGGLLFNERAIVDVISKVKPDSFYNSRHKKIYEAIAGLYKESLPVDVVSVSERLRNKKQLDDVGGRAYVNDLALNVITTANIGYYADIIQSKFVLREILKLSGNMNDLVNDNSNPQEVIKSLYDKISQISCLSASESKVERISDFMIDVFNDIEHNYARKGKITGVASGFPVLDKRTGGFQAGDLIILAARPSMGKTALALNFARTAASQENAKPVLIFSLEMSKSQLGQRLMAMETGINSQNIRNGTLNDKEDWLKIAQAFNSFNEQNLYVDDQADITIEEIRARAKDLYVKNDGLALILVDYIGLIATSGKEQREREISRISAGLKSLARDLNVPVIALSQLSRGVESRQDKHPVLSDLRDSGSLEQDADIVMFVYRDAYYNPTDENKFKAELLLSKHRKGETGVIEMNWNRYITSFESPAVKVEEGGNVF